MVSGLKVVARVAVVGALLWLLVHKGFLSLEETRQAFARPAYSLTGIALVVATLFISSTRWHRLLHALGFRLSWARALELTSIGTFFNIALPGSVTGDLVKAYYLGQEGPLQGASGESNKAKGFGVIVFDRVLGLSGLVLVSAVALLADVPGASQNAQFQALWWFVELTAAAVVVFYAYILIVNPDADPFMAVLRRLEARVPAVGALRRFVDGFRDFHQHPGTVAAALLLSVVNQATVGLACYMFTQALGETFITLRTVYAVVLSGLVVTTLPVGPAGVGTGHVALLYLLKLVGSDRGADVFTLFWLAQMLIGLGGGVVYLRFRAGAAPRPPSP